jgi:hypothetical protein
VIVACAGAGEVLFLQKRSEVGRELGGVEGAGGEEAAVEFEGGDFAAAVVYLEDEFFGVGKFVNVNFFEGNVVLEEKAAGAAAVGTPVS